MPAVIAAFAALLVAAPAALADPPSTTIASSGPLSVITIGNDLSCQVKHQDDALRSFFPSDQALGDCGTFVATGGALYAPNFGAHNRSSTSINVGLGAYTPFTPLSQSGVTGSGTHADPFRLTTVGGVGGTGLRVTETDSYATGEESYRTDVTVENFAGGPQDVVLYRAADCHLQGDDEGFGFADPPSGSIGCSATPNNTPAGRVEQWVPITGGNNFLEAYFTDMWLAIGSKAPLPNQCARCGEKIDNAAGISWSFSVPAGGSVTKAHYTTLSPASAGGPPNNPIAGPGGRGGTTRNFGGTSLTLTGPKGCVKPPAKARFRVTSKRKKGISADRFGFVRRVKILRVDFFVEKVHKAKDLKAAFKAFLSTAGLAPASQHSVSANVLLQPLREHGRQVRTGKKFHTILRAPLTICP